MHYCPIDQFKYYIWHNPDDDSKPTKPPNYVLFENLFYKKFFVSWDLENRDTAPVQCEVLHRCTVVLYTDICPGDMVNCSWLSSRGGGGVGGKGAVKIEISNRAVMAS